MKIAINEFVDNLFTTENIESMDSWPDDFDSIDSIKLVKAIAGSKHLGKKFVLTNPHSDSERLNLLLDKYNEARPKVTGEIFDKAFNALKISFDYGVLGAEEFQVKAFVNGSILIRNHHRVIAIDKRPHSVVRVSSQKLRKELNTWVKSIPESDGGVDPFFMIHREEPKNGVYSASSIVMTKSVPKELNEFGQTLVFFGKGIDTSGISCLSGADIPGCKENSRIGYVMLQVFRDFVFVYGMFRASDEYDVLLEEFSSAGFFEYDEPVKVKFPSHDDSLEYIGSMVLELAQNASVGYLDATDAMGYYIKSRLTDPYNRSSYAREKYKQICCITPRFHHHWATPVSFFNNGNQYLDISKELDHKIVVLNLTRQSFNDLTQIGSGFGEFISGPSFRHLGICTKKYISTKQDEISEMGDISEFGTEPAKKWLKDLFESLREETKTEIDNGSGELDENAFSMDAEFCIRVLMVFKEMPLPEAVLRFIKEYTLTNSNWAEIYIPAIGACGSYENGEEDESNLENFVPDNEDD